ncbi:unnamed protein product [Lepidochelys kempii]
MHSPGIISQGLGTCRSHWSPQQQRKVLSLRGQLQSHSLPPARILPLAARAGLGWAGHSPARSSGRCRRRSKSIAEQRIRAGIDAIAVPPLPFPSLLFSSLLPRPGTCTRPPQRQAPAAAAGNGVSES